MKDPEGQVDVWCTRLFISNDKAQQLRKNNSLSLKLDSLLQKIDSNRELTRKQANLIIYWCSVVKQQFWERSQILLEFILASNLLSNLEIDNALDFIGSQVDSHFDLKQFEKYIGSMASISEERIYECAKKFFNQGQFNNGSHLMRLVTKELKSADRLKIKQQLEDEKYVLNDSSKKAKNRVHNYESLFEDKSKFHLPQDIYKTNGYVITDNTHKLLKEHNIRTNGKFITRFPPEPNGLLHIGHAKSIILNFGLAKYFGGHTYLRFDDTNPENEDEKFIRDIKDCIEWLGYRPYKITHASDYFHQMFKFAQILIKKDLAYVCHMSKDELKGCHVKPSPWRNRLINESLELFDQMKQGQLDEGTACLRLKYTMLDGKKDPVAYRIKFCSHPVTKNEWCIYPSYDFAHPICDSLEDITHSLCSKEFETHRPFYYWLCNSLDIYCPVQWEFARLNVAGTITSKRKLKLLNSQGLVKGLNDPRLFTLAGLKRRGVSPHIIYSFCESNSVTTSQSIIQQHNIDSHIRQKLNLTSPRAVCILKPLSIKISNFTPDKSVLEFEIPDFLEKKSKQNNTVSSHKFEMTSHIYIDQRDFDFKGLDSDFRRLTPKQSVGLLFTDYQLTFEKYENSDSKNQILARIDKIDPNTPPRSYIHWISNPMMCEVRLFKKLFNSDAPDKPEHGGFLNCIDEQSIEIIKNAYVERRLASGKIGDSFQFVREGYFCIDEDTSNYKLVFNLTVNLKEDPKKNF